MQFCRLFRPGLTANAMSWHGGRRGRRYYHDDGDRNNYGHGARGFREDDDGRYGRDRDADYREQDDGPQGHDRWRNRGGRGRQDYRRGQGRGGEGQGERRGRPPFGLRGRDIGMFYAARSKAKKERREIEERPLVAMESSDMNKIKKVLDSMKEGPEERDYTKTEKSRPKTAPSLSRATGATGSSKDSAPGRHASAVSTDKTFTGASNLEADMGGSDLGEELSGWGASASPEKKRVKKQRGFKTEPEEDCTVSSQKIASSSVKEEENVETEFPDVEEIKEFSEDLDQILPEGSSDLEFDQEISRLPDLDDQFKEELEEKSLNPKYKKMLLCRQRLPAYKQQKEVVELINSNQIIVLSGETGCGKTTQVPQFILDHFIERGMGSMCNIICTQPRRISAISVAERVADERAEKCSQFDRSSSVGYSIRLENRLPRKRGSILFCTTGIILRRLESDPTLKSVSHIIIDEVHERDLLCDFLMVVVKDLVAVRADLRVILMSATLNAEKFSKYFNNCPHINIPGFTYPVKEYFLEDAVQLTGYYPEQSAQPRRKGRWGGKWRKQQMMEEEEEKWKMDAWARNLPANKYSRDTISALERMDLKKIDLDLVMEVLRHIVNNMEDGAVLVFVPGWKEISDLNKMLEKDSRMNNGKLRIVPLHSLMPTVNQREVFDRPPPGIRKIVIATNIAETSITIDDIVYVVDCGFIKVKDFQPDTGLLSLDSHPVSRANAQQRKGRAGRVQAGHCFHLFTSLQYEEMKEYLAPEILRTRLEELCLMIKMLKLGKIEPFVSKALDVPSAESVRAAIVLLRNLQALDDDEELLPLGYHLARLPLDPHTGKMILFAAIFGCLDPVCLVAACLSFKSPFFTPLGKESQADRCRKELAGRSKSDHMMLIKAFKGWEKATRNGNGGKFCYDNFMSEATLRLLKKMKKQFAELLFDIGFVNSSDPENRKSNVHSGNENLITAVVCAGLYPNIAKVTKEAIPGKRSVSVQLQNGGKAFVHKQSVNSYVTFFPSKWLIYHKIMKTQTVNVYDCSMVSPYPLLFFGGKISYSVSPVKGRDRECIKVDDWITFWTDKATFDLVKDLRRQLDRILEDRIVSPKAFDLTVESRDQVIINAIVDLICKEEVNFHNFRDEDFDEFS
ncbi:LOW QUALITY PROTEIN: ATP-dependent DNA/RNA helicase DHX36-like [Saccostrea cucullata]|uniref:LOW QUALITY PROTEIN: ATP-dependent DNA/RNA helicase DHX36-like n=1 Tax=Saccostrea cuccullata TaxID=36930 RepID=UPI002ED3F736